MTEQLTDLEIDFLKELIQKHIKRYPLFENSAKALIERLEK